MEPSTQTTSPAIPIAIIFGFTMIAIAIFFTGSKESDTPILSDNSVNTNQDEKIRPVSEDDYIYGNPNAPILMVEYSDYDCPFCKQFHETMNQIMKEYGISGQLAWVYRQFPIADLHPNSPKISEAALCVGDIGGNEAFWQFTNLIFAERNLEDPTNVTKLPKYAETSGVSRDEYIECMNSRRMKDAVQDSFEDAYNAGLQGTPHTILIVGNQQAVINGAQTYDYVDSVISNLIDQLNGNFDPLNIPPEPENAVSSETP